MEEKHLIHKWAKLLQDEPVTRDEAQLYTLISANDRLMELLVAFQDIQMRLTRLEAYMAAKAPGYQQEVSRHLAALQTGS